MRTVAHLLVFLTAAAMGKRLSFAGTAWDKHKQEVANVRNTLWPCVPCVRRRARGMPVRVAGAARRVAQVLLRVPTE